MQRKSYKASAPGSLMLLGEYAVLYNKPALVCAVNKRMTVTLTPRLDEKIQIESALGRFSTKISHIKIEEPFQFVLSVLKTYQHKLKSGCDIQIESEFSHQVGLGSSAAVTAATFAALTQWLQINMTQKNLLRQSRKVVLNVQGAGSGADVCASVYGGIVCYTSSPLKIEKFSDICPLTLLYSGFKTPTVQAIQQVKLYFKKFPVLFKRICESIEQCVLAGRQAVQKKDWETLGKLMNMQQGLMETLGVNLPVLQDMVNVLRSQSGMLGAKISGSGLGDCVMGLGTSVPVQKYLSIPASMTLQGVKREKT